VQNADSVASDKIDVYLHKAVIKLDDWVSRKNLHQWNATLWCFCKYLQEVIQCLQFKVKSDRQAGRFMDFSNAMCHELEFLELAEVKANRLSWRLHVWKSLAWTRRNKHHANGNFHCRPGATFRVLTKWKPSEQQEERKSNE